MNLSVPEIMLLMLLGGIIGAVINAKKGWSPLVGFLGGVLLGPCLVWLFLIQRDNPEGLGLRKCPFCAEWVKKKASVCTFCNKELQPAVPPIV
jgi:hypothetical protein